MPVKENRLPSVNRPSREIPTTQSSSPSNDSTLPKLNVTRTKSRMRQRKAVPNNNEMAPNEIPCCWVASNKDLLTGNNPYEKHQAKPRLPDIQNNNGKVSRKVLRDQFKLQQSKMGNERATLPTLKPSITGETKTTYQPRPPSSVRVTRVPQITPTEPPHSRFDPQLEHRENILHDNWDNQHGGNRSFSALRRMPNPPSQPPPDNRRQPPPAHLPPLALRRERDH